ncbi:thiosulfate oxidation carrier protein SoxY [Nitratireductor mangrovi]|uniref:Thiosulfate oxidation carrier protein SoxY n=1 Tax=Nitratireductor mangrovi TaxID=2599600 RepID=A0A5B8L402_9HYPH|nr:thiosulfate oxidation carrier protein SoxY [Nitratireductor mangrovi]QDZ02645.1 thiosulfate oxidation carrier protein SoxY [Nitratireductor mangrovi]
MNINRREALGFAAGAAAFAVTGLRPVPALATAEDAEKRIMEFAGGKMPETGKLTLVAPEIAENGNTVPISIEVDSAMSGDDVVEQVMVLADGNPNPDVATFNFTEASGIAAATTRMRLAKTQNVIAVARMKDGTTYMDKKEVKVTIGGCGG